jgi:hypothetical protein
MLKRGYQIQVRKFCTDAYFNPRFENPIGVGNLFLRNSAATRKRN